MSISKIIDMLDEVQKQLHSVEFAVNRPPLMLYEMGEVCEMLRVSRPTLDSYIKDGTLRQTNIGKRKLFTREAIENFIHHQTG